MVEQTPQLPERRSSSRRTVRVVELDMTRVVGGNPVKDLSWYDNEWGFTSRERRCSAGPPL
jgi:glyceraldehyde-3-phosphate dehydrogenase/erythrose-4-phosphate dehydrogenase